VTYVSPDGEVQMRVRSGIGLRYISHRAEGALIPVLLITARGWEARSKVTAAQGRGRPMEKVRTMAASRRSPNLSGKPNLTPNTRKTFESQIVLLFSCPMRGKVWGSRLGGAVCLGVEPARDSFGSVTLNITPTARWLMAQSSDFRLTSVGEDGKRVIESETGQKQVVLHYPDLSGLVCYTGVAKYRLPGRPSHDTAAWLQKVLEHPADERRRPQDVVDLLIREGSVWLRKIRPEDRRHTFTMITYDEKAKPHVYVISNFERPGQPSKPTGADKLFCTPIRPRGPRCALPGGRRRSRRNRGRRSQTYWPMCRHQSD
jgi:hypothetical protein